MLIEITIRRRVLVNPWRISIPPNNATIAAAHITPLFFTPPLVWVRLIISAITPAALNFRNSLVCYVTPSNVMLRRAPFTISPLTITYPIMITDTRAKTGTQSKKLR